LPYIKQLLLFVILFLATDPKGRNKRIKFSTKKRKKKCIKGFLFFFGECNGNIEFPDGLSETSTLASKFNYVLINVTFQALVSQKKSLLRIA